MYQTGLYEWFSLDKEISKDRSFAGIALADGESVSFAPVDVYGIAAGVGGKADVLQGGGGAAPKPPPRKSESHDLQPLGALHPVVASPCNRFSSLIRP